MDYKKQLSTIQLEKIQDILSELPLYCRDFFDYCDGTLNRSAATLFQYAHDIKTFFNFLLEQNPLINTYNDITLDFLDELTPRDIQEYMSYLRNHKDHITGKMLSNDASARARKLSSLRSFYQYYFTFAGLHQNPAKLISSPKIHNKKQSRLDSEETKEFLNNIKSSSLDDKKCPYAKRTELRDSAIIALLAGTGIRVSELVGIDLKDIDWEHNCIKIIRKGGNEDIVYFGEEIKKYLKNYIENERPSDVDTPALFLSSRSVKERLMPRSVERVVSKYAAATLPSKKITPHSLRRTFGTNYYEKSSDLYAVADALGHKNIQVTKDHYADVSDRKKQQVKSFSDELLKSESEDSTKKTQY